MSLNGIVKLFCPNCGAEIYYNDDTKPRPWCSREFGIICGKDCHRELELKYARMILGKDSI